MSYMENMAVTMMTSSHLLGPVIVVTLFLDHWIGQRAFTTSKEREKK